MRPITSTNTGYSLIETMTVLLTLALLLSVALPGFSSILRRTQAEIQIYSLINAAQLARSQAVTRQQAVVLCASADQTACGNDWTQGAMVFVDTNNNRRVDEDEALLTTLPATPKGSQLVMKAALNKQYLRYMSNGLLENTAGSFIYCPANGTARDARNLIFNRTGRMRPGSDKNKDGILENAEGQPLSCPL